MSICLIHFGKFDRNQFRVLFDWFGFIHRCFFHSRWSCPNQAVIPSLDLHTSFHSTSFNDHWKFNAFSVCLFQTPYHHSLVIDLGSNHRLTLFHHFVTTQIGLASMFQSFVWSMLRMQIRNLWEIEDPNWTNRVWFNVQNRNVLYLIILQIGDDWMNTIKWMNWIVLDSLIKLLYWKAWIEWKWMRMDFLVRFVLNGDSLLSLLVVL